MRINGIAILLFAAVAWGTAGLWWALSRRDAGRAGSDLGEAHRVADTRSTGPPRLSGRARIHYPAVDLDAVDRDRDVHGIVTTRDGSPIEGASIQFLHHPWRHEGVWTRAGWCEAHVLAATRSAFNGTFVMPLQEGTYGMLHVAASGYADMRYPLLRSGGRVRVILGPPVQLSVLTEDQHGSPVPGATVRLLRDRDSNCVDRVAPTDVAGVCTFDGLPPRSGWHVEVEHPSLGNPRRARATLPSEGTQRLTIQLPPGNEFRVLVVDHRTREPIEGARVRRDTPIAPWIEAGEDGTCSVPGIRDTGGSSVVAEAPGYIRGGETGYADSLVVVELRRQTVITGRVVDDRGQPIAAAQIAGHGVYKDRYGRPYGRDSTRTGADGRFALNGLGPQVHLVVLAHGRGALEFNVRGVAPRNDRLDLGDLHMTPERVVRGRVFDHEGNPSAHVRVTLQRVLDSEDRDLLSHVPVLRSAPPDTWGPDEGRCVERRTDDLGRFSFRALSAGIYLVKTVPVGAPVIERELIVGDSDVDELDLVCVPGRSVAVRVHDDAGESLGRVRIELSGPEYVGHTYTDSRGEASVHLPHETVRLVVRSSLPGCFDLPGVVVAPDASSATIVAQRIGLASGTVLAPDGCPLAGARLRLSHGSVVGPPPPFVSRELDDLYPIVSDENGAFRFRFPRGLTTTVVFDGLVERDGCMCWYPARGMAGGIKDGQEDLLLNTDPVPADHALTVRVLDPSGAPVAGATVATVPALAGGDRVTTSEGLCRWVGIPSSEVTVHVVVEDSPSDLWINPEPVRVEPGGPDLIMRVQRGVVLEGIVLDRDGRPQGDTFVNAGHATDPKDRLSFLEGTWTDETGRFRLVLPPRKRAELTVIAWRGWRQGPFFARIESVSVEDSPITIQQK